MDNMVFGSGPAMRLGAGLVAGTVGERCMEAEIFKGRKKRWPRRVTTGPLPARFTLVMTSSQAPISNNNAVATRITG